MWIIEVIPISRSFLRDEALTYFSTKKLNPGALVEIGLRNKNVLAISVGAEKLETQKASLKRGAFVLKKINKVLSEGFLNPEFISSLNSVSEYFLISPSSLLRFFLPNTILKKTFYLKSGDLFPAKTGAGEFKRTFYQAERQERMKYYRGLIREALSRARSTAIILPTISSAQDAFEDLKVGIEDRTFLLHGDLSAKKLAESRRGIIESKNPTVAVGTSPILAFLKPDSATLIIDEDSSEYYYNSLRRPFFDLRRTAEVVAGKMGLHLIFGDIVLPLDSDPEPGAILSHGRVLSSAENRVIDASKKSPGEFKILSPELRDLISEAVFKKESLVIIGHRRGLNPATLCQDCGGTITCSNCSSPLVTHQKNESQKHFFCHYCLRKEEIVERCPNCKSWRIASFGAGVEKIGEELKKTYPEIKLFRFDSDVIRSRKEAEEIRRQFNEHPGSVMVATEIFANFFRTPLPHVAVAAIDGLFSIPDYRMHERILNFLIRLRMLAQKSFTIQTRLPSHPVFNYAVSGNVSGFKSQELEERKKLGYPPTVDLIKITADDTDRARLISRVSALAEEIRKTRQLEGSDPASWDVVDFPAFITKIKGRFRWHILLRLKRNSWPLKHAGIKKILAGLPPSWTIQVDPPSLL